MRNFGIVEKSLTIEMLIRPHAKINIGLYVTSRRDDGFHNIESLFYPVGLSDLVEFIADTDIDADIFTTSGLKIPGEKENNLILRACKELRKICKLPFLRIHLHKRIPMGAGLGGGSSDAAFFLHEAAKITKPVPDRAALKEIALKLGSDCPYFLNPVSSLAAGRGEILKSFPLELKDYCLSIFNPGIHVSTSEAYANVDIGTPGVELAEALQRPLEEWKLTINNSFESYVFAQYPLVKKIRDELYSKGAVFASMSGSGSSIFSISRTRLVLPPELQKYHIWTEMI